MNSLKRIPLHPARGPLSALNLARDCRHTHTHTHCHTLAYTQTYMFDIHKYMFKVHASTRTHTHGRYNYEKCWQASSVSHFPALQKGDSSVCSPLACADTSLEDFFCWPPEVYHLMKPNGLQHFNLGSRAPLSAYLNLLQLGSSS
jgi:hypothetical protein